MEDIEIFANHSAFMRSTYLHGKILFEATSAPDKYLMERVAPIFFGDLNRVLIEYVILQVCKITDPARDFRKNDNQTVAFLLQHYDFSTDEAVRKRLTQLRDELDAFGEKLRPARNKLVSHSDRAAILAGHPLGAATDTEWFAFWHALEELVNTIHEKVMGTPFLISRVGILSDVDGLLRALRHANYFDKLLGDRDPTVRARCQELALG